MAFGDYLKKQLKDGVFLNCTDEKGTPNFFNYVLRDTVVEDFKLCSPQKIDSNIAGRIYNAILSEYIDDLPDFTCVILTSSKQERFREIVSDVFSRHAFCSTGLANQKNIVAIRCEMENANRTVITYQWKESNL